CRLAGLQVIKVFTDRIPGELIIGLTAIDVRLNETRVRGDWGTAMATVAHYFRSDPLCNCADRPWINRESEIGMAVDIDKARRNHESVRIQCRNPIGPLDSAHLLNLSAANCHIGTIRRPSRAVHNVSANDQ